MRPAHLILGCLVVFAGLAGWSLYSDRDGPPPPSETAGDEVVDPQSGGPAQSERSLVGSQKQAQGRSPEDVAEPEAARPGTDPTLRLRVRSLATHADVAAFRWRFRNGEHVRRGQGSSGLADIALPPAVLGELLVEADGFAPLVRTARTAAAGAPAAAVDVFLAPAVRAAGITLMIHDVAFQPIPHVRVDAFVIQPDAGETPFHLGTPLWARRTSAEDGRYVLPDLPPGDYGIRVLATDAEGTTLPLLPFLRRFKLTGDNGYVEDVSLEPACLPVLELVDPIGNPIDPAKTAITGLSLYLPGGPKVERIWIASTQSGTTSALGVPPAAGPTWPAQPMPAGTYMLEVLVGGEVRVQQHVTLRAGERQQERVVVP